MERTALAWGTQAPWFHAPTPKNPKFTFSSLGGRFVVMVFFDRSTVPAARAALTTIAEANLPRDDDQYVIFGIARHDSEADAELVTRAFPERRVFLDTSENISTLYKAQVEGSRAYHHHWLILDPQLRVYASGPLSAADELVARIRALPDALEHTGTPLWAPVLLVPRVLSTDFCREMINYYEHGQPEASGTMQERDGITVAVHNRDFKRRADVHIEDERLRQTLRASIAARLVPEIKKAYQFNVTRIERYIVARYSGEDQGFFRAHRDNTTKGTAHRRFAVTINLNAEDYDGGTLCFPEFGPQTYKAPTGGAVVFSCSLLHEARPVTRGTRYATLPFLYDDAAAKIRDDNLRYLDAGSGGKHGADT